MEKLDLDLAISRLLLGYQIINIDNVEIKIVNPSIELLHKANLLVKNLYLKNKYSAFSKKLLTKHFVLKKILDHDYEQKFEQMNKGLDSLKIELFKSRILTEKVKRIRTSIATHKKNISNYCYNVDNLFYYSIENSIEQSRLYYIYLKTTFIDDKLLFDESNIDYSLLNRVISQLQINALSTKDIREIARSGEWRSYWLLGKEKTFARPIYELSEDQRLLCTWSNVYDDAFQASDFPRPIIDDDDMFDGWRLVKFEEYEENLKGSAIKAMSNGKHYDMRFFPAETQEEANNIYQLNTATSQEKIRRLGQEIQNKGEVRVSTDQLV